MLLNCLDLDTQLRKYNSLHGIAYHFSSKKNPYIKMFWIALGLFHLERIGQISSILSLTNSRVTAHTRTHPHRQEVT